jgi:phage terminase small subunit
VEKILSARKLSPKEKAFCRAFFDLREGKNAAIKAGYAPKTATVTASKLLTKGKIQAEIKRLEDKLEDAVICSKEWLIREWMKVADSDPADVMTWTESGIDMIPSVDLTKEKRKLIKTLSHTTTATGESFKVELQDRDSARKELAKLLGYYPDEGTGEAVKLVFLFGENKRANGS